MIGKIAKNLETIRLYIFHDPSTPSKFSKIFININIKICDGILKSQITKSTTKKNVSK